MGQEAHLKRLLIDQSPLTERELRLFVLTLGWSEHLVVISPKLTGFNLPQEIDLVQEIRQWCIENIGSDLRHWVPSGCKPYETRWTSVAAVSNLMWPITYAFKFDHDAVHFKMRWYNP